MEEYNKSDHKLVKGEEFRRFLSFFHKADLLQLLDESYKTPEFLNAKLTELNNKNSESQNDIRALFKDDS
ncbi:MAG: hypothetical protein LBD11_06975 [Candidatus Peribacteria bacterium]|nr:hypothetical protein [Candidatus Peribacteria bacterium]